MLLSHLSETARLWLCLFLSYTGSSFHHFQVQPVHSVTQTGIRLFRTSVHNLDYRSHSLIGSLLLCNKSEILSPFFVWRWTSYPTSKVLLKKRMNYRSQPVCLALFYFTSVNSSSAEIVHVQGAILCVYGSIHSEGHRLHILLATKAELVAINCFS